MTISELPPPPSGRVGWPWTVGSPPPPRRETPWPRITLVTPSFNQGAYIEETIRSVLLQGYPDLEYIVIDGGSTDNTAAILEKYAPWLAFRVSEPDRGQSHAINKGLSRATGEWFNWLNSDDLLAPGALFALASAASADTHIVAGITANLRGASVFSRYSAHVPTRMPETLFSLRVNQPGSLLRLSSVRETGGVRDDLRLVMDLDLWTRILFRHGPSAYVSLQTEVATYRYHDASKTCSAEDAFALEEFAVLFDSAASLGVTMPPRLRALRARCAAAVPTSSKPDSGLSPTEIERAWLDRLVVHDSLLYRALRKTANDAGLHEEFHASLLELSPPLSRRALGRAWVHALEHENRFVPSAAWRALHLAPSAYTLRSLLRLALQKR